MYYIDSVQVIFLIYPETSENKLVDIYFSSNFFFLVDVCLWEKGTFNLSDQIILFITFALNRFRYKLLTPFSSFCWNVLAWTYKPTDFKLFNKFTLIEYQWTLYTFFRLPTKLLFVLSQVSSWIISSWIISKIFEVETYLPSRKNLRIYLGNN